MSTAPPLINIKALTFDVFGTVFDWRTPITTALTTAASSKASANLPSLPQPTLTTLLATPWPLFAQRWRSSYSTFTRSFIPGVTPWKDIDTHHRESLASLLSSHGLAEVFTPEEVEGLAREWHFLQPWADSAPGLERINKGGYVTATLSNGNLELLRDLDSGLRGSGSGGEGGFKHLLSAEMFRAYKPHPSVYLGACEALGLEPKEVAMVAAHLGDLAAARALGMRTVYVEREGEEEWEVGEERYEEARGWVDLWVGVGEGGFEEVARRLGG